MFLGQGPASEPLLVPNTDEQPGFIYIMPSLHGVVVVITFTEDPLEVKDSCTHPAQDLNIISH